MCCCEADLLDKAYSDTRLPGRLGMGFRHAMMPLIADNITDDEEEYLEHQIYIWIIASERPPVKWSDQPIVSEKKPPTMMIM
jgi:hypothetical protein